MNWIKKHSQILLFIICLFSLIIIYYSLSVEFGSNLNNLRTTLLMLFLAITPFSLVFFFTRINVWKIWYKMTLLLACLGGLIITLSPVSNGDSFITMKLISSLFFVVFYSLISIGILIYGYFKKN